MAGKAKGKGGPFGTGPGAGDGGAAELAREWESIPDGDARGNLETLETDLPPELTPVDSWDDFFQAPEGVISCQVRRRAPETWFDPKTGERVNAMGYCGDIPYGTDVERHISEHFGGGSYQVTLMLNHKFHRSRKVLVPGPPILTVRPAPQFIPNKPEAASGNNLVLVDGTDSGAEIPLGGSRNDWEERLTRFAATQAMIRGIAPPAPIDVNAGLLQMIVSLIGHQGKADGSSSLREQLENLQMLREMSGVESGGGGSGGVADLIGKALEMLPKLAAMSQLKNRTAPAAPQPLPLPMPAGTTPAVELPETTSPAPEEPLTAYQEMIDRALETIATHYSLPTPTAPATVAGALMVAFPLPALIRDRVKANAQELAALGLTLLSDDKLAAADTAATWTAYVVAVIESFADPNRKGPLEGLKL